MATAIFLRVLEPKPEEKGAALAAAVQSAREGHLDGRSTFAVDPSSFRQVPGAPFAYWVSDGLRRKFRELPPFESEGRTVKQGLATADDFRFVRAWWEVDPRRILHVPVQAQELDDPRRLREYQEACREQTRHGKRWVPFAKGGAYSPYYADVYLVVDWENDGERIRNFYGPNGRLASRPQNTEYYFRPGLTWPRRTTRTLSVRQFPAGAIFADKGPVAFDASLFSLLAGMNSQVFLAAVMAQLGAADAAARSYEVGVIQKTPVPSLNTPAAREAGISASRHLVIKQSLDRVNEVAHLFSVPALLQVTDVATLALRCGAWQTHVDAAETEAAAAQSEVESGAFTLYGMTGADRAQVEEWTGPSAMDGSVELDEEDEDAEVDQDPGQASGTVAALLSFGVGCLFGRWDVRIAADPTLCPELPGPFDPLAPCSPAMLVGSNGLPARSGSIVSESWLRARPIVGTLPPASVQPATVPDAAYPLRISWNGILVDDDDHPDDIVRRSREPLATLFGEQSGAIEGEAVQLLGFKDLRDYFRNPRGFWADHLRRYSKKPRKAPIYWLLQSKKRHYAVWLYYPRLDGDLLFKVLQFYLEPKIRREEQRLADLRAQIGGSDGARARRQAERAVEQQEALLADIREFRERLARVADLHLVPNLDDGVVLNAAPLHELMPWPEPAHYWQDLLRGKYDWSDIGRQIRERQGQGVKLA